MVQYLSKGMKKITYILIILISLVLGWFLNDLYQKNIGEYDSEIPIISKKPLEKYTIENLSKTEIPEVEIIKEKLISETDSYSSHLISYSFDPSLSGKTEKKVTGLLNLPKTTGKHPIVVLIRGYVDQTIYQTGVGTKRVGEYFAENGYITVSLDYLGYAGSSSESSNIFESRFQTYTTTLVLINSLGSIGDWDGKNIFIWAHSNGGQIALTTLAISGYNYKTVLWAPVTKPFPYNILYYTDESEDKGKFIRNKLAEFEKNYDVENYNFLNYLGNIKAPILLLQGTNDDAVPVSWSETFYKTAKDKDIDISYQVIPGGDHNMNPYWDQAIENSLQYFKQ